MMGTVGGAIGAVGEAMGAIGGVIGAAGGVIGAVGGAIGVGRECDYLWLHFNSDDGTNDSTLDPVVTLNEFPGDAPL